MDNFGDDIPPNRDDASEGSWLTASSTESLFEDLGNLDDVQMVRRRVCLLLISDIVVLRETRASQP